MRKRLLMVFALLAMMGLVLVGCKPTKPPIDDDVTFTLTLPEGVASNQEDNTKVAKDATVVLTVTIPEGKELVSFKIDGVETELVSGKAQFKMTKDITVTLELKDKETPDPEVYYKLTLPEGVTSDQADNTKIKKDTDVVLTVTIPEGKELVSFKVDDVEKKADLVDNKLTIKMTKDITVTVEFSSLEPSMVGELYHWMPGAIADTTGLVGTIDLKGIEVDEATGEGLVISINELPALKYLIDYEIEGDKLTVFGKPLNDAELALGDHVLKLETANGVGQMTFHVVDNPIETSIPTKIIKGFNFSEAENHVIPAPIANAPDLFITEINFDRGVFDYIEVFNNTEADYNLKGHRVMFADMAKQKPEYGGLVHESYGMYSSIYIDSDFNIPALKSALLWIVNGRPWNVEGTGAPRKVIETDDAKNYLFEGEQGGKLTLELFKDTYGLAAETLVLPLRPHYMLARTDNGWNYDAGVGLTMAKTANWSSNTGMDNRIVQIQKIEDTKFPVAELPAEAIDAIPEGATHYSYEFKIFNKPEDVYVNGEIDHTKLVHNGARESMNSLALRMRFWKVEGEVETDLGLPLVGNVHTGIDIYNANFASYLTFTTKVVVPITTAIIYQNIDETYAVSGKRWSEKVGLQYTIPNHEAPGYLNTLSRYLVTQSEFKYSEWYPAEDPLRDMKLAGISSQMVPDVQSDFDVVVPIDAGYPTTYLNNYENTAGFTPWFNFYDTKPE